jgi:hypothetical protein
MYRKREERKGLGTEGRKENKEKREKENYMNEKMNGKKRERR